MAPTLPRIAPGVRVRLLVFPSRPYPAFKSVLVFADVGVNVLLVALLAQVCFSMPRPDPDCQRFRGMASAAHQLQQVSIKLLRAMRAELGPVEMDDYRLEHLPAMNFSIDHLCTLTLNESLYELYCGSSLFKLSVDWLDSARAAGRQSLLNQTSVHVTRLVGMTGDALKRLQQEVPPPPAPSLPVVLHSFNVLHYSFEVAARLKLYCDWSKRLLLRVMQLSRCTSALPHLRNLAC
ncbi:unnamed protein product [Gadus morhua 'NCC']